MPDFSFTFRPYGTSWTCEVGGARHIEGGLPGPRQRVGRGGEDEGELRPPAAPTLAASDLSHARQDHRGAPVRDIGIGGESGSSGHTTPGSDLALTMTNADMSEGKSILYSDSLFV